jgi:hypothetical protein
MKNAVFWDVVPYGFCKNDVSEDCISRIIMVRRNSDLLAASYS